MPSQNVAPEGYLPRVIDAQIERYLRLFGAVEITGTRWCGKTWSALAHGSSVTYVDRGANLQIVTADPTFALQGTHPHVIDEWQRVPAVWDYVRHAVDDAGGKRGMWILTGSSTPAKDQVSHSGAGRIGTLSMRPMTLQESGDSTASVSLSGLFEGRFVPCVAPQGIVPLVNMACRGGGPANLKMSADDSLEIVRGYLSTTYSQSIQRLGGTPEIARRLVTSLARNAAQSVKLATLARDVYATPEDSAPTDQEQRTISAHLQLLKDIYLVCEVPGWVPASRSPARMRTSPKYYFADQSVVPATLGMGPQALLQDWQTFGLVFESMCMRDLDVYARAVPGAADTPLHYYHDDSGLEVDAVIELADGRWGAFEVKTGEDKVAEASENLIRMRNKLLRDPRRRVREPSFLGVLLANGESARRNPDGIYVVPIRTLGA